MAIAEERHFPGYPVHVEYCRSYHPRPKHPLLYPIHINDVGQIAQDRPSEFSHPVHPRQVVDLSDRIKDF